MANRLHLVACGFLLAVLWMDLKFDLLMLPYVRGKSAPSDVVDTIAAYYRRALTAERRTFMLIASMMLMGLAAGIVQIAQKNSEAPMWMRAALLAFYVPPILLAIFRIVPIAGRLGAQKENVDRQRAMAKEIFLAHVYCFVSLFVCIFILLAI